MKRTQLWILYGLAAGLLTGLLANIVTAPEAPAEALRPQLEFVAAEVMNPLGKIFLRLLFLTVLPLVFSSLALGVQELRDFRELGKIGLRTLGFTLFLTTVSVGIGLALVNVVEPGKRLDDSSRARLLADIEKDPMGTPSAGRDDRPILERIVTAIIPRNPVEAAARAFEGDMIAVMFFALLFGIALAATRSQRTASLLSLIEGLQDVSMWLIGFAMRLAPFGVAALTFSISAVLGLDIIRVLAAYVLTVLAGLAIQQFLVYPALLKWIGGVSPVAFFGSIRPVMITAFSTSSSNATLPTTLQVARERLGIPSKIANFVLTIGSSFNQNGTALFEGVTVLFIAQAYGISLGLEQQVAVLGMSVLAGIGTAGVPGGSIPFIVPVLVSVGVPADGIALVLGVDRFLDMCRTVLNVTGDMVAATCIASREEPLEPSGP